MATAMDDGGERIQKALEYLETHQTLLANCTALWKTLDTHLSSLEQSFSQKSHSLDSKLQALDSQTHETLETLGQREKSLPDRENEAIARIDQLKQAVLAEFEKPPPSTKLPLSDVLRSHCRRMDSTALWKFLVAKRKELPVLRTEIAPAFAEAVDAARLVLDALEDFVSQKDGKAGTSDQRWACGVLLRELFPTSEYTPAVAGSVSDRAAVVAEKWKEKMNDDDAGGLGPAEAQMFLQMVVGYGIRSRFEEEFLMNLVVKFPTRKGMAKLVEGLGFKEKISGIIDELIKNGKELEAVYFAHDSGLTQQFPPIPLIKAYLKNSRKNANALLKNGHYSMAASEEAGNFELNSLRSIIKCVEDHRLESEFTLDILRKRLSQLERVKADKKRNTVNKSQNKRVRGNNVGGGGGFRPAKAMRPSVRWETPPPHPRPQAHPHHHHHPYHHPAVGYPPPYSYPSQGGYDVPASAPPYASSPYGVAHGQSPAPPPVQHHYIPEDVATARSSMPYTGLASHSGYDYGAAPPPYQQPAQPSQPQ
ncbi:FRIGIDA-like protein 4a [Aristolochia californica]|uniref:FRIGIDA-like protein 4a n=1 Tax=Aristolochia californica TaxID=171875 RepID=UPI0035D8FB8C